ncbi:DUF1566 domain-containing protein [Massilia cavernae]|uniref:DUF1566 domain-containing protein n=1 Tax=Massilia cavernae TaxID=2320864 RepID=A0A418Y169_9BURK|nr:DUF1566 domain-containing protein [Massilia cavernae]RJG19175.1 DUF1566 domain-containing protein [Massilia cavernae]
MSENTAVGNVLGEGERYAGLILGKDGEQDYHLVLLPGEVAEAGWAPATSWARELGGELPSRRELSLLFANQREEFQREWYWSREPQAGHPHLVWGQNFASGIQTVYGRPFRGHARAVRRMAAKG